MTVPLKRELKMGPDGRVVVPADMRAALGLPKGGMVTARVRDGELRLETVQSRVARAQALFRKYDRGHGSMVDELIAERRAEAVSEDAEGAEWRARRK